MVSPIEASFIYPLPLFLSGHLMCQRLHTYSNSSLSFLSLNISHLRVKTTHMAKHNLDFLCSNRIKYRQPHSLILLFVFVSTVNSVLSQTPVTDCILQLSSPLNSSNCEAGNWGGFINNCCSVVFDDYLDALGNILKLHGAE